MSQKMEIKYSEHISSLIFYKHAVGQFYFRGVVRNRNGF